MCLEFGILMVLHEIHENKTFKWSWAVFVTVSVSSNVCGLQTHRKLWAFLSIAENSECRSLISQPLSVNKCLRGLYILRPCPSFLTSSPLLSFSAKWAHRDAVSAWLPFGPMASVHVGLGSWPCCWHDLWYLLFRLKCRRHPSSCTKKPFHTSSPQSQSEEVFLAK